MRKTTYIMRHGHAEYDKLTQKGRNAVEKTASDIYIQMLIGPGPEGMNVAIYHSPRLRTKETAEILAKTLKDGWNVSITERQELLFSEPLGIEKLLWMIPDQLSILVGHEPNIECYLGKNLAPAEYKRVELYTTDDERRAIERELSRKP